jgi:hypothetical protein
VFDFFVLCGTLAANSRSFASKPKTTKKTMKKDTRTPNSCEAELEEYLLSDKKEERKRRQRSIQRGVVLKFCAGGEYGFFFCPKRDAFPKMFELLEEYSSNIRVSTESSLYGDFYTDPETRISIIFSRVQSRIARSLFQHLRGTVKIVTLKGSPIHSFPTTYEGFCELVRSLDSPEAFDRERMLRHLRMTPRKKKDDDEPPIFFKMRAKVPVLKD